MDDNLKFFERYLFEAPGDETPPDMVGVPEETNTGPPEMAPENQDDAAPPEMDDGGGDPPSDEGGGDLDAPPEMDDGAGDSFGGDMGDDGMDTPEEEAPEGLDDKVSQIMNQQLFPRFQELLTTITSQIGNCKGANDLLYTISPKAMEVVPKWKKLEENIRLYLKNNYMQAGYSKNILFFNKCLNLLKLLNDVFDREIRAAKKDAE